RRSWIAISSSAQQKAHSHAHEASQKESNHQRQRSFSDFLSSIGLFCMGLL
ncbi:unnamed protein product, partial [Arabidopsis halleri]